MATRKKREENVEAPEELATATPVEETEEYQAGYRQCAQDVQDMMDGRRVDPWLHNFCREVLKQKDPSPDTSAAVEGSS